jgi:hydroxyethylthiazole kinase
MDLAHALAVLRTERPLVQNITNFVVMNTTANALLALGASPAMVHSSEEVEDFVAISRALVVNIGTLSPDWVASMKLAVARAGAAKIPWVLDPVGAGATPYRTKVSLELAARRPAVIRGNASEILALAGASGAAPKGVDSTASTDQALGAARALAQSMKTVVAVSGAIDVITDGTRTTSLHDGHPMMTLVTGMGCVATALIGAFCAVAPPFEAAVHGLGVLGVAGARAAEDAAGPGTLGVRILDELHGFDPKRSPPSVKPS